MVKRSELKCHMLIIWRSSIERGSRNSRATITRAMCLVYATPTLQLKQLLAHLVARLEPFRTPVKLAYSVRLWARNNARTAAWWKSYLAWENFTKIVSNSDFYLDSTSSTIPLQKSLHAFLRLTQYAFIRAKNVRNKNCKENKTHILYANTSSLQVSKFSR